MVGGVDEFDCDGQFEKCTPPISTALSPTLFSWSQFFTDSGRTNARTIRPSYLPLLEFGPIENAT